ncbi:MAG TPA: hypothetical protein VFI02_11215 [Armatimonadota bacterium]|nr:hypothetical protein [Armatimonadota bacterium]
MESKGSGPAIVKSGLEVVIRDDKPRLSLSGSSATDSSLHAGLKVTFPGKELPGKLLSKNFRGTTIEVGAGYGTGGFDASLTIKGDKRKRTGDISVKPSASIVYEGNRLKPGFKEGFRGDWSSGIMERSGPIDESPTTWFVFRVGF